VRCLDVSIPYTYGVKDLRASARFFATSAAASSSALLLARISVGCGDLVATFDSSEADAVAASTEDASSARHVDSAPPPDSAAEQDSRPSDGGSGFKADACVAAAVGGDDVARFTIRGHVHDSSGLAVVGAHVDLGGAIQATRSTDFTGGFTFHVSPGSYTLSVSGPCGSASSTATLRNVTSNASPDLTAAGAACVTSTPSNVVSSGEVLKLAEEDASAGWTAVNLRQLCAEGDTACCPTQTGMAELQIIAKEQPSTPPRWLTIAGYPAIEQRQTFTTPPPMCPAGCDPGFVARATLLLTTTIAAGGTLVSFGTELPADASADAIALIVTAGESFTSEEIPELAAPSPDE
jgi:hypothetical protein